MPVRGAYLYDRIAFAAKGRSVGSPTSPPVLSLVSRETGEVRSRVMPEVTAATLAKAIAEQVDVASSHLHTDAAYLYRALGREFQSHEWVDHHKFEYVRGDVSTNQAENFFSQLKRSIDGTHHHVSTAHLLRYLAEFDFRFSTCQDSDTARMRQLGWAMSIDKLASSSSTISDTNASDRAPDPLVTTPVRERARLFSLTSLPATCLSPRLPNHHQQQEGGT